MRCIKACCRRMKRATTTATSASRPLPEVHKIPRGDALLQLNHHLHPLSTTTIDSNSAPHAAHLSSTTPMLRFLFHPTRPPDSSWGWSPPNLSANSPIQASPGRNRSLLFRALPSSSRSPCHCRDTAEANLVDGRRYVSRSSPAKCVAQLSRFLEQRKMIGDRGMFPSRLVRGGFPEADV